MNTDIIDNVKMERHRSPGFTGELRPRLLLLAGGLMIFVASGVVTAQIYFFLKSGHWIELPASYLTVLGPDQLVAWLDKPGSFVFVHRIVFNTLDILPVSLLTFLIGRYLLRTAGRFTKHNPSAKRERSIDAAPSRPARAGSTRGLREPNAAGLPDAEHNAPYSVSLD